MTAVVGGNFQATAQRGSRPTAPRRRCELEVVDLDDDAVDLEVELAAAPLPVEALGDHLLLVVEHDGSSGLTRKPCSRSHSSACQWRRRSSSPSVTPTW